MRIHFLLGLISFLSLQSTSYASCFDGLKRSKEFSYQPQLLCSSDLLSDCLSSPHLLLIISVPWSVVGGQISQLSSRQQKERFVVNLVSGTLPERQYWAYNCVASDVKPGVFYNCFKPSDSSPTISSYPMYSQGLKRVSSKSGLYFYDHLKDTLTGYYATYTCHPTEPGIIQLRQYHYGGSKRVYHDGKNVQYVNPTGAFEVIVRVSNFSRTKFVQDEKKRKKVGFTLDPVAIPNLYNRLVPDTMR